MENELMNSMFYNVLAPKMINPHYLNHSLLLLRPKFFIYFCLSNQKTEKYMSVRPHTPNAGHFKPNKMPLISSIIERRFLHNRTPDK